jgi:MoaA/NifB/PqqE/SkfB family radical SAM enzyme
MRESPCRDNLRLGELEFHSRHLYLRSLPRFLGLVLGNACNIDCPHCYQAKNGDNLLKPADAGAELRREFQALYPYLSTLRVQGGEAFAYAGFAALIKDERASVRRPILSASTNGTLIDERWAEQIVRAPFRNLTVSIDAGTPATYARLRRGADLEEVLANVSRIQRWQRKLGADMPYLDSFFVVMRSNFRELPIYFQLMAKSGFSEVSLQTPETNRENSTREPTLVRDEVIADAAEVRELHQVLQLLLPVERRRFRAIRTSGLTSLFDSHGLNSAFLREDSEGLYPDSEGLTGESGFDIPLCPNPWSTLFVAENGDVHLCFLSAPAGNLYQDPLVSIWNSRAALAKRSRMITGQYLASGCSPNWCSWRERKKAAAAGLAGIEAGRAEMQDLTDRAGTALPLVTIGESPSEITSVRRVVSARERTIFELEAMFRHLCETNRQVHAAGGLHIAELESRIAGLEAHAASFEARDAEARAHISRLDAREAAATAHLAHLEAKAAKAVADFQALQQQTLRFRSRRIVRLGSAIARFCRRVIGHAPADRAPWRQADPE